MATSSHSPLVVIEILGKSKKAFHDKLCASSSVQQPLHLQKLRGENTFALAQFFFLLRTFELVDYPDRFVSYVHTHNEQLQNLIDTPSQRKLMGLELPRLQRGLFSALQIAKVKANLASSFQGLDQIDIQRLTILLFSPETGRRLIEVLESSGYLSRTSTPFQSKIVNSTGFVEQCYAEYLDDITNGFK